MTTSRTMSLMLAIARVERSAAHKPHANGTLLIAAALFLAVLIADGILIAAAAPSLADLASLYVTST